MSMDDERSPANGNGTDGQPRGQSANGHESAAEEKLLRSAMPPKNGEDVPLPPVDETPLEIPPELFREEARETQENGGAPQATATRPAPYIVFDHVSKSFGDLHVLDDVSFEVLTGETLCILGRSGVGKSVSLQQIMGFLKPEKGRILVAGEDITAFSDEQMGPVRKKVTMVFQSGALFDSLSVGENVAFPLRERKELEEDQIQKIVTGLLEMVGVTGMTDLLPSDLSTGMKRSVAIARAMAAQPEAILYDEPTTMVDPLIARLLGDLIQKLRTQLLLTSVVVTHDMRFAERLADHVVFLHQGKVLFFGTMEEMKRSDDEILRQFLELDALVLPDV
ncbi:MAG TPA: ATP-binding cassette domain-containing protein [Acidobacteriaceae bacterium]|jgi:phospholipid/cholesterol/gamma-HCH transport system ATP-binding protein